MFNHCLTRDQLSALIFVKFLDTETEKNSEMLVNLLAESEYWQVHLHCMNYHLSMVLERLYKDGVDPNLILDSIYSLPDSMWFSIHEHDGMFIDYLFRNIRQKELPLEEDLLNIQYNQINYIYE